MVLSSDEPAGLPWDLLFSAGFCWRLLGVDWIDYDWDLNETENKNMNFKNTVNFVCHHAYEHMTILLCFRFSATRIYLASQHKQLLS